MRARVARTTGTLHAVIVIDHAVTARGGDERVGDRRLHREVHRRRMFVLQQPRVEHGARVRFPSADGLDHVDAVAARAKGDREEDTPAVQRERVRDGATERMLGERSEQVVGEGVGHGCVGLVDGEHRRAFAGSAAHRQSELELSERARKIEVVVVPVEDDILIAERERELVGLRRARLEMKPVARTEAAKLRRRRVVDDSRRE